MTRLGRASLFALSGVTLVLGVSAGCSSPAPQGSPGVAGTAGTSSGGNSTSGGSSSGSPSGGTPNGGSGMTTAGSGGKGGSPVSTGGNAGNGGSAGSGGSAGNAGNAGSGGTAGSGGSAGSGGGGGGDTAGSGGTGGGGGTAGSGGSAGCAILPATQPVIYDFPPSGAGGTAAATPIPGFTFGFDNNPPTVSSGYSFLYPDTLTSDVSEGNWHVSGTVGTYAGFQIAFVCGTDASAYKGISFKISGNAGPSGLSFAVAHAADVWHDPSSGAATAAKCTAPAQYDGTCQEASATVQVAATEATVSLLWADIKNGKPQANPNPAELMALRWLFAWSGATVAYPVDLRLDDLTFIAP